jgi:hypothetical protein
MEQKEPQLNDVGTRYEHLCDYRDSLELCIQILSKRGLYLPTDKQNFIELTAALKVVSRTIDAHSGIFDEQAQYQLYRQVDSIPKDPESILPTRGTPLT